MTKQPARLGFTGTDKFGIVKLQLANTDTPGDLFINLGGHDNLLGLADEIRISDIVRYSSNFTPPSGPFVCDANTKALWHFDEPEAEHGFSRCLWHCRQLSYGL